MRIMSRVVGGVTSLCCLSLFGATAEPVLLYCSDVVSNVGVFSEALPAQGKKAKLVLSAFGYIEPSFVDIIWGDYLGRRLMWPHDSNLVIVTNYTQLQESTYPRSAYRGTIEDVHWSQNCTSVRAVKAIKHGYDIWCTKDGQSSYAGNIRFSQDKKNVYIENELGVIRCVLWNWNESGLSPKESYLQDPTLKVDGLDKVLIADVYGWRRFLDTIRGYGPRNSRNTRYVKSFEEFVVSSGYKLKK